jgi:radical SAM protein with 4Fe4S-binding SPASM domain
MAIAANWAPSTLGPVFAHEVGSLLGHCSGGPDSAVILHGVGRLPDGPAQYGRSLIEVFEEWVRRDIGSVYVQMFDTALANWYGQVGGMCVHAGTCGSRLALEHTGDLYSCDHYVEPGYLLGNINDTRAHHPLITIQSRRAPRHHARKSHPAPGPSSGSGPCRSGCGRRTRTG